MATSPIVWKQVVDFAPALCTVNTPAQNIILAMVASQMNPDAWGAKLTTGAILLAAHIATIASGGGLGPVTQESVGQLSRSYAVNPAALKNGFASSAYGTEYARLVWSLPTCLGLVP